MASARLRRAFRYPDDLGDENAREELDEEEQERVIKNFKIQNDKRDAEYRVIFAVLPLVSATLLLPSLFSSSSLFSVRLLSLLGALSLTMTAYTMRYLPPQRPDPKGKRPIRKQDPTMEARKFLPPANAAISAILVIAYFFSSEAGSSTLTWPTACLLPGAMFSTILVMQKLMISVNLKSLEDLRYEYKGA